MSTEQEKLNTETFLRIAEEAEAEAYEARQNLEFGRQSKLLERARQHRDIAEGPKRFPPFEE